MNAGRTTLVFIGIGALTLLVGCQTTPTQQGALMGGALGAGAGAIIGNQVHHSAGTGALIGGLGGAAAGALIGEQTGNRGGVVPPPPPPPPPPPAPVVVQPAPVVVQPYPVVERGVTVLIDPEDYYYAYGPAYHHHYYDLRTGRYMDVVVRTVPPGYRYIHGRLDIRRIPEKHFRHPGIIRHYR